jgi:hypothetical protein
MVELQYSIMLIVNVQNHKQIRLACTNLVCPHVLLLNPYYI